MNRTTLACLLVAITPFAAAQDLEKKISVEIPASRASVAFAALGKAAGLTIEPATNLRDEVFVIAVHDASVGDVLKRIAQAESGNWIQQSGRYILTRDGSVSVAQEKAEIAARASVIAKAIAKLSDAVTPNSKFDEAAAQKLAEDTKNILDQTSRGGDGGPKRIDVGNAAEKTPTARAITRLLTALDPAKLAQIGANQRVVFSTQPTPMQISLPNAGYNAFNQFITEQVAYTQAYKANDPQDGSRVFMINGVSNPTMGAGDPRLGLGVGLVVVERRSEGGLNIQILAADPKGDTIASGNYTLQLPPAEVKPASASDEEPLKISAESKEMAKILGGAGGANRPVAMRVVSVSNGGGEFSVQAMDSGDSGPGASPELRKKLLHPETYEPLSFAPGEAMLALAAQKQKNLVALLPDYCFGTLTRQLAASTTPSQLLASLTPMHHLVNSEDGSWIVVSPAAPAYGRGNTVNRSALGLLLRSLDKNGSLRLDDLADFAVSQNKVPGMNDFDVAYARMINPGAANRSMLPLATGSYSLYRFYGTLSAGQRQAIQASQQLPFMNLSQQQLTMVADMLYNSPQGPTVQADNPGPGRNDVRQSVTFAVNQSIGGPTPFFFAGNLSAKTERTIVMPNGVTNDGYLLGSVNMQPAVQAINSATGATNFFDAPSLAMNRSSANVAGGSGGYTPPVYDKYRLARQTSISLRFVLSPRVTLARSLSDTSLEADAQSVPFESLPADFRQRVQQAADQMQNAFQKIPGRFQVAPPPLK